MCKKLVSLFLAALMTMLCIGVTAEVEAPVSFPYTGEEVVFSGFGYDGLDQNPELPCIQAWQEHIGNIKVDYEFLAYSDYLEKYKIMLSTGDMPDILPVPNIRGVIAQYGDTGMLLDFSKYLDYMPNLQKYLESYPNLNYICTESGARYGIVGVQPLDRGGEGWFANIDVLRAAGIEEVPQTFEEMLDAMRKVKANDPSVTPFLSYWKTAYAAEWMGRALLGADYHGVNQVWYDTEKGEYTLNYRGESAQKRKELIALLHTLYEEGLLHPEIATMSDEQAKALLAGGKWAFTALYTGSLETEICKVEKGAPLPFDVAPMLPPATDKGERVLPLQYQHDGLPHWGIVCSADVEHPELLAAYMDQVVSPAGRDIFNYGIEGVTYDVIDGVPTMKEGIDRNEYGVGSQYEVWMVGMGKTKADQTGFVLRDTIDALYTEKLLDGTITGTFDPTLVSFSEEAAAEKASLENDLTTYIAEQEAAFIHGQRDLAEWDAFLAELEEIADMDALLTLYNEAETIVRDPARVYVAE
jgi:putative aldouronate transport system substrate-binding protein